MGGKPRGYGSGEVRLIGGSMRGRKLRFPDVNGLRPSSDRMRETLFNWLQPYIAGSNCLDLFAGSGALGFEAMSRGASSLTMVERDTEVFRALQQNARQLKVEEVSIFQADALNWLQRCKATFDLVFVDPPFADEIAESALAGLSAGDCLKDGALIYVETASNQRMQFPPGWIPFKEKTAGQVICRLLRSQSVDSAQKDAIS